MKKYILALLALIVINISYAQYQDTLKILAIGNSFSEDALENYLHDLAKNNNKPIIIANMYIGGAPISLHVTNYKENKAIYSYRKVGLDGIKITTKNVSIQTALKDENWDYISLQQASPMSGKYDVIMQDLPTLYNFVKTANPDAKIVYHQTWAYQQNSTHKGFENYDKSQLKMYNDIVKTAKKLKKSKLFTFIAPAGTAIQNARTSSLGDTYTRDGYHLELNYGRFTAACTWYEMLFKEDVRKNTYKPEKVTDTQAKIAKEAAHKAAKAPFKISKVKL